MRRSCLTSKFVCSSGDVNVFQWNGEWLFSRRVKFDSWFNVMAVYEVSWQGPELIYRFTGIQKWVMRWWKRPLWFSKKIYVTISLNWSMPYQGGCSQFLISSRKFDSSICDWKNKCSLFGKYHLFCSESFRVDFRCVRRFQLLNVCNEYRVYRLSRTLSGLGGPKNFFYGTLHLYYYHFFQGKTTGS